MLIYFDKKYRPWIEEARNVLNDIVFSAWYSKPEVCLYDEGDDEIIIEITYDGSDKEQASAIHGMVDLVQVFFQGFISARDKSFSDSFKA